MLGVGCRIQLALQENRGVMQIWQEKPTSVSKVTDQVPKSFELQRDRSLDKGELVTQLGATIELGGVSNLRDEVGANSYSTNDVVLVLVDLDASKDITKGPHLMRWKQC